MNGAAEFCSNLNIYTNKKALYEYKKTIKRSNGRGIVYTLLGIFLISLIARYEFESDSPFWTYISGFALLCGVIKCLQVAEERLLLISPLGLQTTTVYCSGTCYTSYIPWCCVQDVIVNEAVNGFRMVHYLAVLVKDDSEKGKLLPLLLNSKLRLPEIKEIYYNIQKVLKP